jgi:hypothetical protein
MLYRYNKYIIKSPSVNSLGRIPLKLYNGQDG